MHEESPGVNSTLRSLRRCDCLVERRRSLRSKHLLVRLRRVAVGKREFEVLGEQLLDVWPADVVCLLNLHDFQDLEAELACQLCNSLRWWNIRESS